MYLRFYVLMSHTENPYLVCSTAAKQRTPITIDINPKSFDASFEDMIKDPNVNIDEDQEAVYKPGGDYVGKVWVMYVEQDAPVRRYPVYWHCPKNATNFGLYYKRCLGPNLPGPLIPINYYEMTDIIWAQRDERI